MIPVVLSGGSGTRLWPLSRAQFPKQFCELLDESLLQKTLQRVRGLDSPWVLTVKDLDVLTARVMKEIGLSSQQIIAEPMGRNTAPAIALLCRLFELRGQPQAVVGVFPADHLVTNEAAFRSALALAEEAASKGYVATLGIRPNKPATGFGYIETQANARFSKGDVRAFDVAGFREKPDRATAERFVASGNFFWNAGIFVFQVARMCENFRTLMPELWAAMSTLKPDLSNLREVYQASPAISIDYGIMEKLREQVCVPCDIGWSDLGSWDDVAALDGQPANGSAPKLDNHAHVVASGSKDSFVYAAAPKVYGLVDVEDLIIVDTADAMLVTRRGHSQNVRAVVDKLNEQRHVTARSHLSESRPWGRFTVVRDEPHFKSKILVIDPRAQISYQSHAKRAEHWIFVSGRGEVILDDKVIAVQTGSAVFIPLGAKHRVRNTGTEPLEFVEVQTGSYFGEDDITRYQDDYNRV